MHLCKNSQLYSDFFLHLLFCPENETNRKSAKKYLLTENACRLKYLFLGVFILSSCGRENLKAVKNILIELS